MKNLIFKTFWLATASLTLSSVAASAETPAAMSTKIEPQLAQAIETTLLEAEAEDTDLSEAALAQVTSVSQLTDVRPTDWAFQALQSLVERYGCIAGYPDKTYSGNRALTRYEFAAGLNACLDRVNELIAAATADLVKKEDLAILQRLQEEFAVELATIRGRVDALEARTTTLEKQQFSTTTKLNGEVVVGIAGVASGRTIGGRAVSKNTIVGDRVRLNFDTSFTGRDLLRTRLQASNLTTLPAARDNGDLLTREGSFRFAGDGDNEIDLDALLYQFPLGRQTTVTIEANAGAIDDFTDTLNPFLDGDGATGALTQFGTRNSIYYLLGGTGVGVRHSFGDALELSFGYLASDAANPTNGAGLFNGAYGAIAQLTFRPSQSLALGLTYVHAYNNDFTAEGSVGSDLANFRDLGLATSVNAYGIEASFQLSPKININGSVGYTNAQTLTGARGNLDIWNWSVGLALPDLGKKGNLAGIIVGQEPKVTGISGTLGQLFGRDRSTSLHVEGFYQYQLTDNIALTPGVVWLTAPNHDDRNADVVIGAVRATFTF
ncbi:MAG: iron uptake porin [Phormidesmis sp. CAN_BIN36]|nr:iron uptake porin [Phormidesmis sp. CAN_BIN36]